MEDPSVSSEGDQPTQTEVPGSHQTWETINLAFVELVNYCDSAKFSKQFVDYAKRDWQSLKSVDPACYDLDSPHATRLSPTQYYNKALELFKLDHHLTRDRLNACFPDMAILGQPNHYFDQVLVIWCDLLPQIDELRDQRKHTLFYEDRRKLIGAAWGIPAPQITSQMKIMTEVRKEVDWECVTPLILSTSSEEIRGRMGIIKKLKPSLFPKNAPNYHDVVMKELFGYSKEHLEVFQELLPLSGHSPDHPFFSEQNTQERAITWLGDWINRETQDLKEMLEKYRLLLMAMDESQTRDIHGHLPHWTPGQVRTFVNTVVVPFLHQTIKNDEAFMIEVGMENEIPFSVVMIALENHKEDIQPWCEEAEEHFEALLLTSMVQPGMLSLVTMDYIKDVLCTALCMQPIVLKYHCEKLKEKETILFREEMALKEKIEFIIAVLVEENSRILNKKLEILEDILAMQDWVGKGMDAHHHQRLAHSLLWMNRFYIDKITPHWNIICRKLRSLQERADFVAEVAASPNLNALEILIIEYGAKSQSENVGNIQDK